MRLLPVWLILGLLTGVSLGPLGSAPASAKGTAGEQDKPPTPWDAIEKHEKAIKAVPGFKELSVGGVNGEPNFVIRVEDENARDAVRAIVGERLGRYPVYILVAAPTGRDAEGCTRCPIHCRERLSHATVAAPGNAAPPRPTRFDVDRIDDPKYAQEKCDIIRKYLGLPKLNEQLRCQEMVSWTNDPMKVKWILEQGFPHWRSKEMGGLAGSNGFSCADHGVHQNGEILCYTWIKHKQFCPLGMKQILKEIDEQTPTKGSRP